MSILEIFDIPNGFITWDMLYYPKLTSAVGYAHHFSFAVSTIFTPPATYMILKKSTKPMGFYKYVLLQNIIINYILEVFYYLLGPVVLLPYLMVYFDGALKSIDSGYGVIVMLYFFLFMLTWIFGSWISASIYRISKVFPLSKINVFLESPKNFVMVHAGIIICFEMIMTSPFAIFLFQPFNSTVATEYVIVDQPAYANFSKLNPPITIVGCDFKNYCRLVLNLATVAFLLFCLLAFIFAIAIVPVYLLKVHQLSHASNSIAKMNKMLFIALLAQSAILCIWMGFFIVILFFLVFKLPVVMPYGVLISQLVSSTTLFYPTLEIMVLLYFIKPYRQYVKEIMEKPGLLWCIKTISHGTQTQENIVQPPNIKLFVFRSRNAQNEHKEGDK